MPSLPSKLAMDMLGFDEEPVNIKFGLTSYHLSSGLKSSGIAALYEFPHDV